MSITITGDNFFQSEYYKHQKSLWGRLEFPIGNHNNLCWTARYVGGTSIYLCECKKPSECPGVLAAAEDWAEYLASKE